MADMKNPSDDERLARYVRDGRLRQYPARNSARALVLAWLAEQFTPGTLYTEAEVNERLADHAVDHATLRRYLVDAGMLERGQGLYKRMANIDT
jgi:hypothetical protein